MNRTFLSVMLCASSIAACGGSKETAATTTATPPSMTAAAFPATLLAEQDLTTQTATAYSLDWSLDGEVLAVASGVEVTVLPKDLTKALAVVKPGKGALAAALSPDGATLATVGGLRDRTIEIQGWDSRASPDVQRISATSDQYAVSWSPDGSLLATLANDRTSTIQIWDTGAGTMVNSFDLPYANPRRVLQWSANGRQIYDAGEANGKVVYFRMDVASGSVDELAQLPIANATAVAFSPDFQRIAAADDAGKVQIRDLGTGTVLAEFQSVSTPIDMAWNPKSATLAVLSYGTALQLWSIAL